MAPVPISLGVEMTKESFPTVKKHLRHPPIPRFLSPPTNKIAREGESVRFDCVVLWASKGTAKTVWSKDGFPLSPSSRIIPEEDEQLRSLTIRQVSAHDSGLYLITVENAHGSAELSLTLDVIGRHRCNESEKMRPLICCSSSDVQSSSEVQLRGQKGGQRNGIAGKELISMANSHPPGLPPTFLQHLSDFSCSEGQRIELLAKIRGAEKVVWVKNDRLLPNSSYFKYVHSHQSQNYKLVIKDAFPEDSGLYICEAYNQSGGSITFATVTVTAGLPPKKLPCFGESPSSADESRRGRRKCSELMATSDPSGIHMESSAHNPNEKEISASAVELPTSLRTLNGQVEVRGDTLCVIPHEGSSEVTMTSDPDSDWGTVRRPSEDTMISPDDICGPGTDALEMLAELAVAGIIECAEALAHVSPLPVVIDHLAEVDLRHDSGIIAGIDDADEDDHKSDHDESDRDHVDHKSDHGDQCCGLQVTCEEKAAVVPAVPSLSIVEYKGPPGGKPPTVMGPTYLIALKGEPVSIRIKANGSPQPKVEWTKNGKACAYIEENAEVSSVQIRNVTYDDSGRYAATVSNPHGTVSHHCFLAVEGPPQPPSTPPSTVLNRNGNSISISWSGSPYDGGSILTGYIIQSSTREQEWTELALVNSLTYTLVSPTTGSSYQFRVTCKNMYGQGPPSDASPPLTVSSLPMNPEPSERSPCQLSPEEDDEQEAACLQVLDIQIRPGSFQDFYVKGEELGKGRFGTVFNAKEKASGREFAGKIIRCIKGADKVKVRQEVEIMNSLRHPKLLQIMDALENDKEICIITEKINGGELFERVVADDFTLTEFDCIGFMRQIADGVRFMHQKNIIHLDLKPENILCLTRSNYNIKIIDFGLSQKYERDVPLRVLFGTPEFIAPEIINYEPISPASDMWAVGVITYVLLSGLSPFMGESDSETFTNITQGVFDFEDEAFDHISEDAKDFISQLLRRRQEKRLTAGECLEHKWLAYPEPKKNNVIPTDKLKRFIIRRKWQKTGNAIRALGRMAMNLSKKSVSGDLSSSSCASGSMKSDWGNESLIKARESSSLEEESEDEVLTAETKRLQLQRQQRVDSSSSNI